MQIIAETLVRSAFLTGQQPEPLLTVSQWSDKYRVLSQSVSAEAGYWRTERTPYLKEIMDCLSARSPIQTVVVQKGSQVGLSEAGNNWVGYIIDYAPAPTMIVQPNEMLAKRYSKQRLDPMFRDTERLHEKIKTQKKDADNTILTKIFNGGILVITGANSAAGLRSMPIRNLMLDEIDGYPIDVDGEGDPVSLAVARARTFARRKILKISSPTIEGRSRIATDYKLSDQREFFIPCPHCDYYQTIKWEKIKWEDNQPETAYLECSHCSKKIEEHYKSQFLAKGKWIAQNSKAPKDTAGFILSSLYSPLGWFSWKDAARQFLESKDNPVMLRVFVNTVLGETWKEKGDAPDWIRLFERRENYPMNVMPKGACFITCGVDIQKSRVEIELVGWGKDKESWSIDYRVIQGDTSDYKFLESALDPILNEDFPIEGSRKTAKVSVLAIDSGFNTHAVYAWARGKQPRVIVVKGQETLPSVVGRPSLVDVSYQGQKIKRGIQLWPVGTNICKTELYGWLGMSGPTNENETYPKGYCHFPQYGDDFFKMLTAEQIRIQTVRGYRKYVWDKIRERNEALDIRVYNRAAAYVYGMDRFQEEDWKKLYEGVREVQSINPSTQETKKGGIPIKRDGDFW